METILSLGAALFTLILLIVFFIMSSNIGSLKRIVENQIFRQNNPIINYSSAFSEGELMEFLGKRDEALICYKKAKYLYNRYASKNAATDQDVKNLKMIDDKIQSFENKMSSAA